MYMLPSNDCVGNFPVWYEYMVLVFLLDNVEKQYMSHVASGSCFGFISNLFDCWTLVVERMFSLVWCICPLLVAGESSKYFVTLCFVNRGKVTRWLLLIALMRVVFVGENKHWYRYLTKSSCVDVWWMLFICFVVSCCICVFFLIFLYRIWVLALNLFCGSLCHIAESDCYVRSYNSCVQTGLHILLHIIFEQILKTGALSRRI